MKIRRFWKLAAHMAHSSERGKFTMQIYNYLHVASTRKRGKKNNVQRWQWKKRERYSSIYKGRYTGLGNVSCGISFGLYRLSSSWCSLEAESDDIVSTIVSSPWTWNTCIETFHRFFFFFSFFNLLSFPFLRKGRFSPRFSEWNVNFDARKLKKKVLSNYLSIAIFKIKAFVSFNYILPSSFHIFCIELDFFGIFFARVEKEKKKKIIWAHTYELFNIQCLFVFQYDLGCWIYKFVGKEENWILFEKYRQRWDEYFNDIQQRVISRVALYPLKYNVKTANFNQPSNNLATTACNKKLTTRINNP